MLSFLYPLFLFGALAAAVPIVLHLLKREAAPEVPFSAVRLLRREPTEHSRRQRLRELLLLALRVTAIVLLAAAFARPYMSAGTHAASSVTIVAVDTSLSMGAPGRFEHARQLARAAVEQAPGGSLVGLVSFDDRPTLVVEPRVERSAVLTGIEALRSGFGATRYGPAIARAQDAIPGHGRIIVVTDLQRAGWDQAERAVLAPGVEVRVADVGDGPTENLAVVGVQSSRAGVLAVIRNAGAREREARGVLRADGREIGTSRVQVPAGETADLVFGAVPASAGAVSVTIEDAGGWPGDDQRYLVTGAQTGPRVIAVSERAGDGLLFVQRALAAAPEQAPFRVEAIAATGLGRALASGEPAAAVLVAGGRGFERSASEALQQHLAAGGGLIVAAGPGLNPEAAAALTGLRTPPRAASEAEVRLAAVDTRHPIFQPFGSTAPALGGIRFTRTWDLDEDGWVVLARFTDGRAALIERRVDKGRVLVFASDLGEAWNDFPVHPAYVPFLHEAVRHVTQARPARGERFIAEMAETPSGARRAPGVVLVSGRRVAVNVDPRESDPARVDQAAFTASLGAMRTAAVADQAVHTRDREASQRYWRYGLMLMLAALVGEGLLAGGYRFA